MNLGYFRPHTLTPPHRVTRPEHVDALADDMRLWGWRGDALVGYRLHGETQLLSGTHRQAAADRLGLYVPVMMHPLADVTAAWGTDDWFRIMHSGESIYWCGRYGSIIAPANDSRVSVIEP